MTETTTSTPEAAPTKKRAGGLEGMLLPQLKQMAGGLGIKGAGGMRKSQLVDAIKAAQSAGRSGGQSDSESGGSARAKRSGSEETAPPAEKAASRDEAPQREHEPREERSKGEGRERGDSRDQGSRGEQQAQGGDRDQGSRGDDRDQGNRGESRDQGADRDQGSRGESRNRGESRDRGDQGNREQGNREQGNRGESRDQGADRDQGNRGDNRNDESGSRSSRSRRRRGRDRNDNRNDNRSERSDRQDSRSDRGSRGSRNEPDTQILEDDVLVPVAGILDVLDNYAFVRTSGYLPGSDDVYVSLSMVRKLGLRRGDAITGQVRQPREGERKEKFNPLVRIETVNGADPEAARSRVEFQKLTPLYPSERLRLETEAGNLIGRVIDIAAPIGKGQRGLIVSPAKAGKTMIMQSIANSITTNNPECHLMVVLVDERPEEVTDFQRSVKGEVISSTFDRPASDHTAVAELAIERAKRLVELGHDVVVLLDGITRLGRAYNLAAPASGRILSGGVDSAALYPPKRFFGAARNIEDGGSLTIIATALIESGSKMDEVIFEEFKGTGNMEIRLRRDFADKRLYPAIDAVQSGTRREELLMSKEELAIVWKLRRVLSGLDGQQALELLLERLKKTQSNVEFLMQVQKTTPTAGNGGD